MCCLQNHQADNESLTTTHVLTCVTQLSVRFETAWCVGKKEIFEIIVLQQGLNKDVSPADLFREDVFNQTLVG